jgi:hypothetical protein
MKIWQYNTQPIDNLRQSCIDQVKANKPQAVDYELISAPPSILLLTLPSIIPSINSNAIRYGLLSLNPNDVWFDTDIRIKSWWVPPADGFIYLNPSASIIFPNGNKAVFEQMYKEYLKIGGVNYITFFLKKNSIAFKIIPEGNFQHLMLHFTKSNFTFIGNGECAVRKAPDGTLSLAWIKGETVKA